MAMRAEWGRHRENALPPLTLLPLPLTTLPTDSPHAVTITTLYSRTEPMIQGIPGEETAWIT